MTDVALNVFSHAPLSADVQTSLARWRRAPGVDTIAVMPDVHLAHDVCIGTVIATHDHLYPAAVGGDIGCGMLTVQLDIDASCVTTESAPRVLAALAAAVPVMRHTVPLPWPGDLPRAPPHARLRVAQTRAQLGTVGRGNHFLELQADDADQLWGLLHSGSRGAGQGIRAHHLRDPRVPLRAHTPAGRAYLADVAWARAYAQANRQAMLINALRVLHQVLGARPRPQTACDCDHNHVESMPLRGRQVWVHRKGALNAGVDVPGIVPGSMGTASYHTRGRGHAAALCSSAHGAGRQMSRSEAQHRLTVAGLHASMQGVFFNRRRARGLLPEAPAAYKDVQRVMRAQRQLVRIERRLRPVLNYKGI